MVDAVSHPYLSRKVYHAIEVALVEQRLHRDAILTAHANKSQLRIAFARERFAKLSRLCSYARIGQPRLFEIGIMDSIGCHSAVGVSASEAGACIGTAPRDI